MNEEGGERERAIWAIERDQSPDREQAIVRDKNKEVEAEERRKEWERERVGRVENLTRDVFPYAKDGAERGVTREGEERDREHGREGERSEEMETGAHK